MTKQEFIEELRQLLSDEVSSEVVMDSYRYYSSYIEEEMKNGKSEEAVVEELGGPSLIARSIIAAHTGQRDADEEYTEDGKTRRVYRNPFGKGGEGHTKAQKMNMKKKFVFRLDAWYAKLLFLLIGILLVVIVFQFLRFGIWIVFKFGIPILLILGIIYLIMYFTK